MHDSILKLKAPPTLAYSSSLCVYPAATQAWQAKMSMAAILAHTILEGLCVEYSRFYSTEYSQQASQVMHSRTSVRATPHQFSSVTLY